MGLYSSKQKEKENKYEGYELHTEYKDQPGIDFPCPLCHYQFECNETKLKCARCLQYASQKKIFTEKDKLDLAKEYPVEELSIIRKYYDGRYLCDIKFLIGPNGYRYNV